MSPEFKKDDNEVGALWEKVSARGPYMTGTVNGQRVVVFLNQKWTEGGTMPKWRVLRSTPKPEPRHVADEDFIIP